MLFATPRIPTRKWPTRHFLRFTLKDAGRTFIPYLSNFPKMCEYTSTTSQAWRLVASQRNLMCSIPSLATLLPYVTCSGHDPTEQWICTNLSWTSTPPTLAPSLHLQFVVVETQEEVVLDFSKDRGSRRCTRHTCLLRSECTTVLEAFHLMNETTQVEGQRLDAWAIGVSMFR